MTVGVGVIGLGFMGGVHLRALRSAARDGVDCRTIAVWDQSEQRRRGDAGVAGNITSTADEPLFDPAEVRVPDTLETFFGDDAIDLVVICTPTDTHIQLAEQAIGAGKHVLIEKPVALEVSSIEALAETARAAGRIAMPAMCMRFWPGWDSLRATILGGEYGPLATLSLLRTGAPPSWSPEFYLDPRRSGDALVDLHIHDVDFIAWVFGTPTTVESTGSTRHVSTRYHFDDRPALVEAEGGWLPDPSTPFRMTYRAAFEEAIVEFDIGAEPRVRVHREGGTAHPELPPGDGYDREIRHLIETIASGGEPAATLAEAAAVTRILAAEQASLVSGRPVSPQSS